jgi:hypothetical protein
VGALPRAFASRKGRPGTPKRSSETGADKTQAGIAVAGFECLTPLGLLRPGSLRSYPVGNYIVFYLPRPDGINVVRILNGYLDITAEDMDYRRAPGVKAGRRALASVALG